MTLQPQNAEEDTIREVAFIDGVKINDKVVEPWIVVHQERDKIAILISNSKIYRALSCKLMIQNGLDILLVDKINETLKKLATGEKEREIEFKKLEAEKNGDKIRESGGTSKDSSDAGHGGDKADSSEFA